jgi:NADH-quinone oxidoreductase subunit J
MTHQTLAQIFFWLLAAIAVGSALLTITRRNAVHSALFLVMCFFSLAGLYVMLNAQFIAAVQVIVYAGAIMVLFLFVVMLLESGNAESGLNTVSFQSALGWTFGIIIALQLAYIFFALKIAAVAKEEMVPQSVINKVGSTEMVSTVLYTKYIYPFEIVSVLLLIAIVGAIVIAKKTRKET